MRVQIKYELFTGLVRGEVSRLPYSAYIAEQSLLYAKERDQRVLVTTAPILLVTPSTPTFPIGYVRLLGALLVATRSNGGERSLIIGEAAR